METKVWKLLLWPAVCMPVWLPSDLSEYFHFWQLRMIVKPAYWDAVGITAVVFIIHLITCQFLHTALPITTLNLTGEVCLWWLLGLWGLKERLLQWPKCSCVSMKLNFGNFCRGQPFVSLHVCRPSRSRRAKSCGGGGGEGEERGGGRGRGVKVTRCFQNLTLKQRSENLQLSLGFRFSDIALFDGSTCLHRK